jgi:FtsP/CotA-like multicopper oxidase with cupredoxin domain
VNRRRALLAAVVVAPLVGCSGMSTSSVSEPPQFDTPLEVPPLATSHVADDGTRVFELTAQEGTSQFLPGVTTPTWGFNGDYLGPTLRAQRGERVAVEITNALPEPTTVHWHGMHLPAAMDGGPHQPIEPGDTWRPSWRIDQPAATLWYHPHPHGRTEEHVYRGLSGLFLVDDPAAPVDLPAEYGVDDVPVVVQDKRFDDDGRLVLDSSGNEIGLLGDTVLVNGVRGAYFDVTTELVRLRVVNGSTARTYEFGFDDGRAFALVGTDGGLLAAPHRTERVRLSPGERAEIVVGMEAGTSVRLRSTPPDLGDVAAPFAFGGNDEFDVLELRAAAVLRPSAPLPAALAELPAVDRSQTEPDRTFVLNGREINGKRMDMDRIDEVVPVDTTEVWQVRNSHPVPHNFHVHDVQFRVLSVDGEPPPPELSGRKDTIYLEPHRTYRISLRFEDYADPDTPLMYHCHLLLHEDEGLMGQLVVVEDDDTPAGDIPGPAGGHRH